MASVGRGANIAKNAALVFAALLVTLALGECVVRIFFPTPPSVTILVSEHRNFESADMEFDQVPEFGSLYIGSRSGLRLRPNTRAVLKREPLSQQTIKIRTNSLGYRGPEVTDREGRRVLFLGDSITLGTYLQEEQTFVHLVGELARAKGKSWNTINAGVGMLSLGNELAILKETGLSTNPDVVVLAFYLNDFQESHGVRVVTPPAWIGWSRLAQYAAQLVARGRADGQGAHKAARKKLNQAIKTELESRLERSSGNWMRAQGAFNDLIVRSYFDWGGAWSETAWTTMRPLFHELKRLSEIHGFELVIIGLPVSHQVETEFIDDWPQRKLAAIASELDVPVLDLLPAHREARNRGPLFYDQCHHTPMGAKVVADATAEFLLEVVGD